MFPLRVSMVTYNLWGSEKWPEREPALRLFGERYRPDVLCVQELTTESRACLDAVLPSHHRVEDPFTGWATEGNIWWSDELFDLVEYGAERFTTDEASDQRMFWVRLAPKDRPQTFFVGNVHLSAPGPVEIGEGRSERVSEIKRVIDHLRRLVQEDEPATLMGDFNDSLAPLSHLFVAGYHSCWAKLSQIPPPTMPAFPDRVLAMGFATNFVFDWIVANGMTRPLSASCPQVYSGYVPPSDHWPVQAVYELLEGPKE